MSYNIQSILVATDFSPDSRRAAQRAALLAQTLPARLRLAHALEPSVVQVLRETLKLSLSSNTQSLLDKPGESLRSLASELSQTAGQEPETELLEGSATATIAKAAAEADLLVLGAQGSHRFRELALGTTAQRIIHEVSCPVLAVRGEVEKPYENVLIATDFAPPSERAALLAPALAPGARLHAAHAFQVHHELQMAYAEVDDDTLNRYHEQARQEAEERMQTFVNATGLLDAGAETSVLAGYPPRMLTELAASRATDLIVIGRQGHSPLDRLLTGSVAQNLLAAAPCDILLVG